MDGKQGDMNKRKITYLIIIGISLITIGLTNEIYAPTFEEINRQSMSGCTYPPPGIEYYIPLAIILVCISLVISCTWLFLSEKTSTSGKK